VFGYFLTEGREVPELAGVIGLQRPAKVKRRHRAMVWGVYVSPMARGHRAASQLLAAVINRAKSMSGLDHLVLSVSNHAEAACRLYRNAGFTEWGREVRAARTGDIWMDEIHMRLNMEDL
ncbi:MAG: GNAT family N-acetyltransferase, partial [Bacteroidota bacterium]